jgi:hypothetical protein
MGRLDVDLDVDVDAEVDGPAIGVHQHQIISRRRPSVSTKTERLPDLTRAVSTATE